MSLSSMISLPSSSSKGFYSCWTTYPRIASPTTSTSLSLSPPVSPPRSPSLMTALPAGPTNGFYSPPVSPPRSPPLTFTLPAGSANSFYSPRPHFTELAATSSSRSGSLSPPMSRPSSPLQTISELFSGQDHGHRASWPVSLPAGPGTPSDRLGQTSDSDHSHLSSRPTSITTSVSYAYTVRSINSRKSRLTVLYPRPVRPTQRTSVVASGAETSKSVILESACASLDSLVQLSSRPVSMTTPIQEYSTSVTDKQHVADVMETLSALFESSPDSFFSVERRLTASWKSLLKIKAYEEKCPTPSFRATRIYADSLLCVHNEIVERNSVDIQELIRPCVGLNEAFEDASILLSNLEAIPHAPEYIPALDADLFKSFVVTIMQLIKLIPALEVLVDSLAIRAVVEASNVTGTAAPDDDVIFNVPGWRQRKESRPTLPSAAAVPVPPGDASDNTLRLLLVTRNEELGGELRGLRFLLWRASPRAKAKLGNIIKLTLPLHHEELMRSPVDDFVVHWQAAVVPPGQGIDDRLIESDSTTAPDLINQRSQRYQPPNVIQARCLNKYD